LFFISGFSVRRKD